MIQPGPSGGRSIRKIRLDWLCLLGLGLFAAETADAETLRQALVLTYKGNPRLNAQRERQRGIGATVALARAQSRPQVSATVGVSRSLTQSGQFAVGVSRDPAVSGGFDLSLSLFEGGRIRNGIKAAQLRVEAGRATLRVVEGDVFSAVVAAYMNVIRDRAIVDLNHGQVRVLAANLDAIRGLYRGGDLTLTDIAQSRARLNLADAQLAEVQALLVTSEEDYRSLTGQAPGDLSPPPPLPPLPATVDEAVRIVLLKNQQIVAATWQAEASGVDVVVARAERLPTVSGVVTGDYLRTVRGQLPGLPLTSTRGAVGVNSRIPLYQGGTPSAHIIQAQALNGQLQEQLLELQRTAIASARSAFASYQAAQRSIQSNAQAVSANELALEGAQVERRVGTRTVIELLNAEQELLASRVQLVTARRNAYVAGFQLLNAMGQAEAQELGLDGGALYDPVGDYRHAAGSESGWKSDPGSENHFSPSGLNRAAVDVSGVLAPAARVAQELQVDDSKIVDRSGAQDISLMTEPKVAAIVAGMRRPMSPSPGKWQLQLGAFRSASAPHALFARLAKQLGGKEPTFQQVGGLTRLLVGDYETAGEARAACQIITQSSACLVVRISAPQLSP